MVYLIRQTLEPCPGEERPISDAPYVAVLTPEQWTRSRDSFEMGIDLEPGALSLHTTKAEVNYDSLTGSFSLPCREDISAPERRFAFALDEKGVVFIDGEGGALELVEAVRAGRKWKMPSLERFLYDFLEQIIRDDLPLLERYERELDAVETAVVDGGAQTDMHRVNQIRSDLRDLRTHYDQLIDLGQELEENENHFFREENLRYFRLFTDRVSRLNDEVSALRDYTVQLRDMYKAQLDVRQNRIMTVLTVVSTIFMPLTLIAGWYGMNFRYMPELEYRASYPIVIAVSVVIVVVSLIFFRKKKWL